MIKINLLGEVKGADHTAILWLIGYGASLVFLLIVGFLALNSANSRIEEVTGENELLQMQLKKIKEQTKSVAELETRKKELDEKIRIIGELKRSKTGPVRVLDDLNISIPERAWLATIKESEGLLRLTGFALDNQTIAGFMKDLVKSDYVESVELIETKDAMRENVKLKSFILDARIKYSGKVKPVSTPQAGAGSAATPSATPAVTPTAAPILEPTNAP